MENSMQRERERRTGTDPSVGKIGFTIVLTVVLFTTNLFPSMPLRRQLQLPLPLQLPQRSEPNKGLGENWISSNSPRDEPYRWLRYRADDDYDNNRSGSHASNDSRYGDQSLPRQPPADIIPWNHDADQKQKQTKTKTKPFQRTLRGIQEGASVNNHHRGIPQQTISFPTSGGPIQDPETIQSQEPATKPPTPAPHEGTPRLSPSAPTPAKKTPAPIASPRTPAPQTEGTPSSLSPSGPSIPTKAPSAATENNNNDSTSTNNYINNNNNNINNQNQQSIPTTPSPIQPPNLTWQPTLGPVQKPTPTPNKAHPDPEPNPNPSPEPSANQRPSDPIASEPTWLPSPWQDIETEIETETPVTSPEGKADEVEGAIGEFCNNIRNQNHIPMLAKQQAGTEGPSFLFSVSVSIVHEEPIPSDTVMGYLNTLSLPIALSISDCQTNPIEQHRDSNSSHPSNSSSSNKGIRRILIGVGQQRRQTVRSLQSRSDTDDFSVVVEYSEVEAWKEDASYKGDEASGCSSPPATKGLVCGDFRSRVIIFLVPNNNNNVTTSTNQSNWENVFRNRIYEALLEHKDSFPDNPGIVTMEINKIEPISIIPGGGGDDQPPRSPGNVNTTTEATGLSRDGIVIVSSLSAGVGGLLLGMVCLLWWRRNPHFYTKHSKFNDDDSSEDYDDWSPPGSPNKQGADGRPQATRKENEACTDSLALGDQGKTSLQLSGLPKEEDNCHTNTRSHRTLPTPSPLQVTVPAPTLTMELSFEDEHDGSEDSVRDINLQHDARYNTDHLSRESRIQHDEYLWLKHLLASSADKIPCCDPSRPCLYSDTVQL